MRNSAFYAIVGAPFALFCVVGSFAVLAVGTGLFFVFALFDGFVLSLSSNCAFISSPMSHSANLVVLLSNSCCVIFSWFPFGTYLHHSIQKNSALFYKVFNADVIVLCDYTEFFDRESRM